MNASSLKKIFRALLCLVLNPAKSLAWVYRGNRLHDRSIESETYWVNGTLPRKPIESIIPETKDIEISIPNAFKRTFRTSITIAEACNIAALVRARAPKRILEVGTFDGNTTLLIARNAPDDAKVVTVDLPPDFNPDKDQASLGHAGTKINLTPRSTVASQYRGHPSESKITQVYGDSASIQWATLGGPFDLIFIDGCHKEAYVRTDSMNALSVLAPGGVILWHDYGDIPDVSSVVDELQETHRELSMCVLEGTRLALASTVM